MSSSQEGSHPVFADGSHVLISGVTGSGDEYGGKSSVAAWWLDTAVPVHFDFGIAFSPKGSRFAGPTVTNAREAADAIGSGSRIVEWSVSGSPTNFDALGDAHAEAMSFASGLAGDVLAVHDDAITYAGADSLKWCCALAGNPSGDGNRIKSIVVSQDPWDLPRKAVRSNLPVLIWVGPVTDEIDKFFRQSGKGPAVDVVRERHDRPFMWSVVDGAGTVSTFNPVPDRYA